MMAGVLVCFVLSAVAITSAQETKTREHRVVTYMSPRDNPTPKTKFELEEIRAHPPKNWPTQRQYVEEALLAGKLEHPVPPSAVMRAKQKYPTLAAARNKVIEAEMAWERLAWKDDEFLQIRSLLAEFDEFLTKSGAFIDLRMQPHEAPARIEQRVQLAGKLREIEKRLAVNEEALKLIAQREQEWSAYKVMLDKLGEIERLEREKARNESAEKFANELNDFKENRTTLPGQPRNLPIDQLPPAERSAMKSIESLQRRVDEIERTSPRTDRQPGNEWLDQLTAARGRLNRAQAKLKDLQRQRAESEQGQ